MKDIYYVAAKLQEIYPDASVTVSKSLYEQGLVCLFKTNDFTVLVYECLFGYFDIEGDLTISGSSVEFPVNAINVWMESRAKRELHTMQRAFNYV